MVNKPTEKKKAPKKRAAKYEKKLKVNASFHEALKALISPKKDK